MNLKVTVVYLYTVIHSSLNNICLKCLKYFSFDKQVSHMTEITDFINV